MDPLIHVASNFQLQDVDKTALQISPSGEVPSPSIVGRDDVAALAVASAMFKSPNEVIAEQQASLETLDPNNINNDDSTSQIQPHAPFHCTLAVRWVGQDMLPYPAQGQKRDGHPTARAGLENALNVNKKEQKKERRLELRRQRQALFGGGGASSSALSKYPETVLRLAANFQQRRVRALKPYGLSVAIPVYLTLTIITRALCRQLVYFLSGQAWAQPWLETLSEFMALITAYCMTHLQILQRQLPRWMTSPKFLLRKFFAPKNYIHF